MATIVLAAAGAALGGSVGGSFIGIASAAIGQAIGAGIGAQIDQRVFGQSSSTTRSKGKVEQFRLQSAAEGTAIARVFGRMRVQGHLIWSTNFKETLTETTTQTRAGKGNRPKKTQTQQTYTYSISLAFALGEGIVSKIGRIWADGQEIAPADVSLTLYKGIADQPPDPTIASIQGMNNTPAFRGTAYVVIENFQLARFGNRIPQFNFEVFRPASATKKDKTAQDHVRAVALIPGSGEYILADEPVEYAGNFGAVKSANSHSQRGKTDFALGVQDLITDAPNCGSVSLVVSWFGDDLRCSNCTLRPKVEQNSAEGSPLAWTSAGLSREDAQVVSYKNNAPVFGGTPSDQSVIQAIKHLKNNGLSVVFYPFILMDIAANNQLDDPWTGRIGQPVIPWRGRITTSLAPNRAGTPDKTARANSEVAAFFGTARASHFTVRNGQVSYSGPNEWSYRRFILHNAALCKAAGGVGAFCIGSEMRALTQIRAQSHSFPAVQQLITLAQEVRTLLGRHTKIGYAADWSEYFGYQINDGAHYNVYYHLDDLWGNANIDFIGIDNYMPISDWRDGQSHLDYQTADNLYNINYLQSNVEGGEGYDWYYASQTARDTQTREMINDSWRNEHWIYRYKDIKNWWGNPHHNRINGTRTRAQTAWQPQSKPIWFTELGCPAIDKGTNQPNVFLDPKSSESFVPYYSNGLQDELIQLRYIKAVMSYWADNENNPASTRYNGRMVDIARAHVWCWDTRPWPEFPARLDIWSDGDNYQLGHWISGRLTHQELGDIVAEICESVGFYDYDVSRIYGLVIGYHIDSLQSARDSLQPLMQAYDFTCVEKDGQLHFQHTREESVKKINKTSIALDIEGQDYYLKTKTSRLNLPGRVRLNYYNPDNHYLSAETEAVLAGEQIANVSRIEIPLALRSAVARHLATNWLHKAQAVQDELTFAMPLSALMLCAGDVVQFCDTDIAESYLITDIEEQGARVINATRIEPTRTLQMEAAATPLLIAPVEATNPITAFLLDIPPINAEHAAHAPYFAASSPNWQGASAYASPETDGYEQIGTAQSPSVLGKTLGVFPRRSPSVWAGGELRVHVSDAGLQSKSALFVLNGANAFAIKDSTATDWEIVQYRDAELQDDGSYILRNFLRGRLGTESVIPDEWPVNADIVFLDRGLAQLDINSDFIGLPMNYLLGPSNQDFTHRYYQNQTFTARGVGLRPYSPSHIQFNRYNNVYHFRWIRRGRIGGDSWDGDVPLGEEREEYLIRVVKDGVEKRRVTVSTPAWDYDALAQTADGTLGGFDLYVAQVSQGYGAGLETKITIKST